MHFRHPLLLACPLLLLLGACSDGRPAAVGGAAPTPTAPGSTMASVHRDHVIVSRYDAATRILTIRLAAGVYRFADVPADVAKRFDQAGKEQDTAYQTMISGKYTATYIPPASAEYAQLGL